MKIDVDGGSVIFESGRIDPGMGRTAFLNSPLGKISERWGGKDPFETYRFLPEPGLTATVDFNEDRLLNVSFQFAMAGDSTSEQSKDRELARKQIHDDWLTVALGEPPYCYHWGQVVSKFYHQHCESDVMVIYES